MNGNVPKPSKQELVDSISEVADLGRIFMLGVGSSIPSAFFDALQEKFRTPQARGMENVAAVICTEYGIPWDEKCDSSLSPSGGGGTVTRYGLESLYKAVCLAMNT
jgi:hypothetical protein